MVKQTESGYTGASSEPSSSQGITHGFLQHSQTGKRGDILQTALLFERIHYLYTNLSFTSIASLLFALILFYTKWNVANHAVLLGWLTAMCIVVLGRAGLFIAWKRYAVDNDRTDALHWLYRFRFGVTLAGILWGIGAVLPFPSGDTTHIAFVSYAIIGLTTVGAITLAVDRFSVSTFLLAVLIPGIIYLAFHESTLSRILSVMATLFLFVLLTSARQLRLRIEENVYLRFIAVENEAVLSQMIEDSPTAARIVDVISNKVVFANKSYAALLELPADQVIGITPQNYYAHPEEYVDTMTAVWQGEKVSNKLVELRNKEGESWIKWTLATYIAMRYKDKPSILGWFYDITDRKVLHDRIEHMAYHDSLTGLPNRELFQDRLQLAINQAEREKSMLAILFVDLDKFKPVNDRHGHHIGDLLLIAVAERIRDCLRKTDSPTRLGGDEFAALLPKVKNEENAIRVAENIRRTLNKPFSIEGLSLEISSSTGIAIYPAHAADLQQLIKHADTAMYYAKTDGRNQVKVYRPEMREQLH